jgi:transposase
MPTRSSSGKTKDQLREGATGVFGDESKAEPANTTLYNKTLHAKIAELTLENDI